MKGAVPFGGCWMEKLLFVAPEPSVVTHSSEGFSKLHHTAERKLLSLLSYMSNLI